MKTIMKRSLSLFLCIVMVLSTMVVGFAAETNTIDATADTKYFQTTSDTKNADIVLDKLDEVLAGLNNGEGIHMTLDLEVISLNVDLRSINALCKTIDDLKDIMSNPIVWAAAKIALGDIGNIDLSVWKTGMKRGSQDITILNEILELLAKNASVISKLVDGSLDIGVASNFVDINSLLGEGGVYGLVKGMLVEMLYEKDSAQYNAAFSKTLDAFVYEDLIPKMIANEEGLLPGFTMNSKSTVDAILTSAYNSAVDKYLAGLINGINAKWMLDQNGNIREDLKDLAAVSDFDGASFDCSALKIDAGSSFASQINNKLGLLVKHFFKGASWTSGDYKKIGDNLNALYLYLAKELGITTSNKASEAVAFEIVKYILERLDGANTELYVNGISSCKNIKDALVLFLRNTAELQGIPVTSDKDATYENILGDFLAYGVKAHVDLGYTAGSGKNVWTVLNDVANVFLFDKGFAKALGLTSLKESDSIFKKLDAVIAMTKVFDGLEPAENYKTENYLKGMIDAIFSLDIAEFVDMTVVRFMGDFGSKNAVKTIYNVLYNTFKSFFGKEIICAYNSSNPLDTAIQNSKLKTTVTNLLTALNSKKSSLIPPVLYIGALLIGVDTKATAVEAGNAIYNGSEAYPETLKITLDGKTFNLILGHDYSGIYVNGPCNIGDTVTGVVDLSGFAKGTATVSYKVILGGVSDLKASSVSTTSAKLSWNAVEGAEKYKVVYAGKTIETTEPSCTLKDLSCGKEYTCKVSAVYGSTAGAADSVKFTTLPAKVSSLKVSSVAATSAKLSWKAASGATGYVVEKSTDGKKWSEVKKVSKTSYTVTGLKDSTTYYFRVKAYAKTSSTVYGEHSSTVKTKTLLGTVSGLKVSSAGTDTISIKWTAVKNATGYKVEYSLDGKKWTSKTTSKTSYKLTKLKAGKTYQIRVTAYDKSKTYGAASSVLKMATAPTAKVTKLKASSITSTTMKLSWKKVSGATGYNVYYSTNKKSWKCVSTTKTSVTLKKLSSNKKYYIKVVPVKKTGSYTAEGVACKTITATTAVAAPTKLKAASTTKTSVKLSWKKVSGASGYEIYRNGKKVGTVKKGSTTSYTDKSLSRYTSYKYKIRAYKTVSGKKVYSDFSSQISAKTKLF